MTKVDVAFDLAAAKTGVRNEGSKIRVCAAPVKPGARRWTATENVFLRSNLGRLTEEEIARALKRTPEAVHIHRERDLHLPSPTKCEDILTAESVSLGLGIDSHSIHKLIDRGIMPGRLSATTDHSIRVIDRRALARWILDPENWVYFHTDRIGELRPRGKRPISPHYAFAYWEELGRLTRTARRRWKDEWLRPSEFAAAAGMRYREPWHLVNLAILKGSLPAKRWGNWWIKRSAIPKGKTLNYRGEWVKA